jgi:hypothetical protein
MLAKVFGLVGKPDEVGAGCATIDIGEVQSLSSRILSDTPQEFAALRQKYLPSALLDPDIGDETLLFWLQHRAWTALEEARQTADSVKAGRCLRGLSLLHSLVRRKLHKVCFTIDRNIYAELSPGSKEGPEIERRIQETPGNPQEEPRKTS